MRYNGTPGPYAASATPKKKRQAISPLQLNTAAWMEATKPQKKTTQAHQMCGGKCFQPMSSHCETI